MVNVYPALNDMQVAKWGNSLAVRIPRAIVKDAGLAEGDRLSIDVEADGTQFAGSTRWMNWWREFRKRIAIARRIGERRE